MIHRLCLNLYHNSHLAVKKNLRIVCWLLAVDALRVMNCREYGRIANLENLCG